MENPEQLLETILAFAGRHQGIEAVLQTGSRARGDRIDRFSDLDIELIGAGTAELVDDDAWLAEIGDVLVALPLANEEPDEPDWPTCLVVFAKGRKVDFTLAGPERLTAMVADGLDELYDRGYSVLLDKSGITAQLPAAARRHPEHDLPPAEEFDSQQREFWFEATQVPIYLARGDYWPAMLRLAEMRDLILTMLEWAAQAAATEDVDTWHNGHHLEEWTRSEYFQAIPGIFPVFGAEAVSALRNAIDLFAQISQDIGAQWGYPVLDLRVPVLAHIDEVIAQ